MPESVVLGVGLLAGGAVSPAMLAAIFITTVAAAATLAMVADTMIPEAVEQAQLLTDLITAIGFVVALTISRAGG